MCSKVLVADGYYAIINANKLEFSRISCHVSSASATRGPSKIVVIQLTYIKDIISVQITTVDTIYLLVNLLIIGGLNYLH